MKSTTQWSQLRQLCGLHFGDCIQLPITVYVFKNVAVDLGAEDAVPRSMENHPTCHHPETNMRCEDQIQSFGSKICKYMYSIQKLWYQSIRPINLKAAVQPYFLKQLIYKDTLHNSCSSMKLRSLAHSVATGWGDHFFWWPSYWNETWNKNGVFTNDSQ